MMTKFLNAILFLVCVFSLSAQTSTVTSNQFHKEVFHDGNGGQLNYQILYPLDYEDSEEDFPLLLFLHGAGERGSDNESQLKHGSSLFTNPDNQQNFPMIVVFPQCPQETYWADVEVTQTCDDCPRNFHFPLREDPNPNMLLVMELLEHIRNEEKVDESKIVLGGLSMGGMGSFELLSRLPNTFVRAFPICGGGNPLVAPLYSPSTEMWIFHGDADAVVDVNLSRKMFDAMKGNARYYEYQGVNHNSWDNAFAEPGLVEWIFSGKR